MDTNALKRFAQEARRKLLAQVEARMAQVLETDSVALREKQGVINELRALINAKGKESVIEEAAYTWFNRLCALRYMDVNQYTRMGIVSPVEGFTQPEILQNAKQGVFNPEWQVDRNRVEGLLSGRITSSDAEQEAYRLLLVSVCNAYAREMDFLFEAIEDYTELLMPEDLLSSQSVPHAVQKTLTQENCQDVEVVGWLYQFYISEKKDEVMAEKGAVKKEDIPAVTQLFTPDWIVRYMVQNSLGRLWLLNYPDSGIRDQMEFYIQPAEPEKDFLKVASPEELKILDPACGSGHILTYAFDLLFTIYEERGYDPLEIPQLILNKNLYGIEIDKRAAMLSSFALMMKAMSKDRHFSKRKISPNILEMEDVVFSSQEIKDYLAKIGKDLWTQDLWEGLQQFDNAKTFGSLIRPVIQDVPYLRKRMEEAGVFEDLFLSNTNNKLMDILDMSEFLSQRYDVVLANPPYMNSSGMNDDLKRFSKEYFPKSKADLYSMFTERNISLLHEKGLVGMITIPNWMFLSSFESFRKHLLDSSVILNLIHNGRGVWGSDFGSCAFILKKISDPEFIGLYKRLFIREGTIASNEMLISRFHNHTNYPFYKKSPQDFQQIPGSPIAYWISNKVARIFINKTIADNSYPKFGMSIGDVQKFTRFWFEVPIRNIGFQSRSKEGFIQSRVRWCPLDKGGGFRRWYGNKEFVVNWQNNGLEIKNNEKSAIRNEAFFFKPHFSWTLVTYGKFASRFFNYGYILDTVSNCVYFHEDIPLMNLLPYLNSKIFQYLLNVINPSMANSCGVIGLIPALLNTTEELVSLPAIEISKRDWDSYENSWEFLVIPLLKAPDLPISLPLSEKYQTLRAEWQVMTDETLHLEEKNNRIFIEAYCLQDELTPEVPLEEITLTCNPHYRYKGGSTQEQREARLLEDTIKEFLSYAVGCMFGRYSLEKTGLVLANQGDTLEDYLRIIGKKPIFIPTETNVIPILDSDWFTDDIVARFKQFLKVTFGELNYDENLRFVEGTLGKDLRNYFLKDFYKDHVQMYKKRPIYWLFSSPKGGFNALIYMHRYHQDTVSILLNQYLRELREKLSAHRKRLEAIIAGSGISSRDKTQALKERESVSLVLQELKDYEDNVFFPLAAQRIQIDLDDGVILNYAKFGDALKKI